MRLEVSHKTTGIAVPGLKKRQKQAVTEATLCAWNCNRAFGHGKKLFFVREGMRKQHCSAAVSERSHVRRALHDGVTMQQNASACN